MNDQNASDSHPTPPVDPYMLARQISADPAIPDEQKASLLAEIGGQLGITSITTMSRMGMPTAMKVRQFVGLIEGRKQMEDTQKEAGREAAGIARSAAGILGQAQRSLADNFAEINKRYLDQALALKERVMGSSDGERK